ncbi:MAG TPA: hypothetical protein VH478_11580 [Trebonia sp.]|jgi:hypothetical protein|nr:hypothetical protein [Trebonia sp.]
MEGVPTGLDIDLNIALLPDRPLAGRLVAASGEFARRYRAIVRLGDPGSRLALAPHLTLYQARLPLAALAGLAGELAAAATGLAPLTLACTGLAYNPGEASLEARTEMPDALVALQDLVISLANPRRGGRLLDRDPAGNRLADLHAAPGALGDSIRRTGYGEAGDPRQGGLFRPHDTLNWFEPGTMVDVAREDTRVNLGGLSGGYPALGIFALGPHGTCPQLLARTAFGG